MPFLLPRHVPSRVRRAVAVFLVALIGFLALGNATIYAAHAWARSTTDTAVPAVEGVKNLRVVDQHVWRGAAPSRSALRHLANAGVTTVVDLRAEEHLRDDSAFLADLGVRLVRLPIRDGQTPTPAEVETFRRAVATSAGTVYVHCGAGVGRTGSIVGAYLVAEHGAGAREALRRNLSVGPPSLEQVVYVAGLEGARVDQPNVVVRVVSRVLDAPRRIWSRLRG